MVQERAGGVDAVGALDEGATDSYAWVYVVDDDPGVRRYLDRLIGDSGLLIKSFQSASEFLDYRRHEGPGCLVLDMCLPGLDGLGLQQSLERRGDPLPIIFISGYGTVRSSVQAMKSGAVDFLTKPLDGTELLAVVARALERSRQEWARSKRDEILRRRFVTLTRREMEVIQHVAQGWINKQIAAELGIVEKTVKVHRGRAMQKLGVKSVAELVQLLGRLELAEFSASLRRETTGTPI